MEQSIEVIKDTNIAVVMSYDMKRHEHYNHVTRYPIGNTSHEPVAHGRRDNLPQIMEDLVCDNNIAPTLLRTKRDLLLGSGLYAYYERIEEGKMVKEPVLISPQVREWLDENQIYSYLRQSARNLILHAMTYTEGVPYRDGSISSIKSHKPRVVRARKKVNGQIPGYLISNRWGALNKIEDKKVTPVRAYTKNIRQKFIYRTGDDMLGDDYYFCPSWWGSRKWIELSNNIPQFHLSNLEHGYTIRYHVQVPRSYILEVVGQKPPEDDQKAMSTWREKIAGAKQAVLDEMNKYLAGAENTGRAVVTYYKQGPSGMQHEIKITAIDTKMNDEALLKLFEKSNQANISSHAVPPSLAAIETSGKLSSGSDIRNSLLMYLATQTPVMRQILLEPLHLVARVNRWDPELRFGIRDVEITTLDQEKTGQREMMS